MDEQDRPMISDHPFESGRPPLEPTECGWDGDGYPCGYDRDEHAIQGEVTPTETP